MAAQTIDRDGPRALVDLLARRGIDDPRLLAALAAVPRDRFVPPDLRPLAWRDMPLPIGQEQTISQPYIVALMALAAGLTAESKVLEVGTGSGYAAAIISRVAGEVFTIERHPSLARTAEERLGELGYDNIHVRVGDGTLGWVEEAPFDAILVAAGGPAVPPSLRDQLAVGGRVIIPVGSTPRDQHLVRWTRLDGGFREEDLGEVRFVPLIGQEGWEEEESKAVRPPPVVPAPWPFEAPGPRVGSATTALVREAAEPFDTLDAVPWGSLAERIGDARVVLVGESTHGTHEFYRLRADLTRRLVQDHGFRIVAIEGDWPDAARIHRWTRGENPGEDWRPFTRFPTWMWRNRETEAFAEWLREWNAAAAPEDRVGFHGLDLYSMHRSIEAVLDYLDERDPEVAAVARLRYGCLTPWETDPALYGRAAVTGRYRSCEGEAVAILTELLDRRMGFMERDGEPFLDALQNARLVVDAERYYRIMYRGGHDSWNLRDRHMYATLKTLLGWRGEGTRAVVWAHNSHVQDAAATEMGPQGQVTLGALAREDLGTRAYRVGQGTDHGTVAAATEWGGPMERKDVRPSRPGSYGAIFHGAEVPAFLLHLRDPVREEIVGELEAPRLHRAIGVIYRPETELRSHYFQASLPHQFDSWIWTDRTEALHALPVPTDPGVPETYPFGL
jgi:protein-L-isoaspartate(D-aspartate) O-methyltransferase